MAGRFTPTVFVLFLYFVFASGQTIFKNTSHCLNVDDDSLMTLSESVNQLTNLVRRQAINIHMLKEELRELREEQAVAFTVRLAKEITLTHNETIPFEDNNILTNIGNAYNSVDSTFYCPKAGLYYFHSMICAQRSLKARAMIVKNNMTDSLGFIYAEDQNNYDCAGNGVVTSLQEGDEVWMKSFLDSAFDTNTFFTGVFLSNL